MQNTNYLTVYFQENSFFHYVYLCLRRVLLNRIFIRNVATNVYTYFFTSLGFQINLMLIFFKIILHMRCMCTITSLIEICHISLTGGLHLA